MQHDHLHEILQLRGVSVLIVCATAMQSVMKRLILESAKVEVASRGPQMARTRQEEPRAMDIWCGIATGQTYWIEGFGVAKPLDPQELEQRSKLSWVIHQWSCPLRVGRLPG